MPITPIHTLIARTIADNLIPGQDELPEDESRGWSIWSPNSRAIEVVKYRRQDGLMTVRFRNRALYPDYLYWNIPPNIFRNWKRAQSAGSYYHRVIKPQFGL